MISEGIYPFSDQSINHLSCTKFITFYKGEKGVFCQMQHLKQINYDGRLSLKYSSNCLIKIHPYLYNISFRRITITNMLFFILLFRDLQHNQIEELEQAHFRRLGNVDTMYVGVYV